MAQALRGQGHGQKRSRGEVTGGWKSNGQEKATRRRQVGTGTKRGRRPSERQGLSGSDGLDGLAVVRQVISRRLGAVSNRWEDHAGSEAAWKTLQGQVREHEGASKVHGGR